MLKGILHVHSTYSDGDCSLAELRERALAAGCRFACVTDHASWFDAARLEAYRRECDARSDDRFRFIAGLEYGCEQRMHVLGYGVTALLDACDPQQVILEIRRLGGVSVIAHPRTEAFGWIETFDVLPDGIEVWNTKYDGRYAPRPETFALHARLRARRPGLAAFCGQDLHWRRQYQGLFTVVACARPDRAAILEALRRGWFAGQRGGLELPAAGLPPAEARARFARTHARAQRFRQLVRQAKAWADRAGIGVPQPIKAQLRRIV